MRVVVGNSESDTSPWAQGKEKEIAVGNGRDVIGHWAQGKEKKYSCR
jgi:hypothetical protein